MLFNWLKSSIKENFNFVVEISIAIHVTYISIDNNMYVCIYVCTNNIVLLMHSTCMNGYSLMITYPWLCTVNIEYNIHSYVHNACIVSCGYNTWHYMAGESAYLSTINMEKFTGLNMKFYEVFHGNTFTVPWPAVYIINYGKLFMGKLSQYSWKPWKPQKFSPVNLSTFTVSIYVSIYISIYLSIYLSYLSIYISLYL